MKSNSQWNLTLVFSALAIGGLTYFYLDYRSGQASRAVDEVVEVIAQETNQRPQTEADLQKLETKSERNVAAIERSELEQQQSRLMAFAKSEFKETRQLHERLEQLSLQILKSPLPMEKRSELNTQLHEMASQKMDQLSPPKVVDTKLDLKDNIIYPVFETK